MFIRVEKRWNSTIDTNRKTITCRIDNHVRLVVPGLSSYSRSSLSSTSRSTDQSNYSRKLGHYQIQWRHEVTSMHAGNRCWQILTRRPRETENQHTKKLDETDKEDPTQGIPDWLQPFTDNLEDLETHVLAHSSERENSDSQGDASKVVTQKRKQSMYNHFTKAEIATYSWEPKLRGFFAENVVRDLFREQKNWWLDNSRAQSPQRRKWILDQSPIGCRGTSSRHYQGPPCRRRTAKHLYHAQKSLVTWWQLITKSWTRSVNQGTITDTLSWYKVLPLHGYSLIHVKKNLRKFLEPLKKPKVIYSDNSLEFAKSCEDWSWNHRTSTPHRSETNGIAERAVRRVKEGTSATLLQSGLDERWWSDSGMLLLSAKPPRPLSGRENSVRKTFRRTIQKVPLFHLEHWLNITQSQHVIKWESINLERKFYQESFWDIHWSMGGRYSDSRSGRLGKVGCIRNSSSTNQRQVNNDQTKKEMTLFSLLQMVPRNFKEETTNSENPLQRCEVFSEKLQGESGESQPTETTDDAEARADF